MTDEKGSAHTVYLQKSDRDTIEKIKQRFGQPFSAALRFIIREWDSYDHIFGSSEAAVVIYEEYAKLSTWERTGTM